MYPVLLHILVTALLKVTVPKCLNASAQMMVSRFLGWAENHLIDI